MYPSAIVLYNMDLFTKSRPCMFYISGNMFFAFCSRLWSKQTFLLTFFLKYCLNGNTDIFVDHYVCFIVVHFQFYTLICEKC